MSFNKKEYTKKYNKEHKEKQREYQRNYFVKNKDEIRRKGRERHSKHKEEDAIRSKKYRDEHKQQRSDYGKKYRLEHKNQIKEKNRVGHLKRKFGMTLEDYNLLFEIQKGQCAICGRHQKELKQALSIDHNHDTGEIRGLLCHECNETLGYAKENTEILANAIIYLWRYSQ